MTTGIGSLPLLDVQEACKLVLATFDIPFWPQLPKLSFREYMGPQYSEGMPFLHLDEVKERIWVERDQSDTLDRFYELYGDSPSSALSPAFAAGFYEMEKQAAGRRFPFFKGQITGPLTFTLEMKDQRGRFIYYDEELREVALMLLGAKAKWQVERLKRFADRIIIFIDEPILSAVGSSAYLGVSREETARILSYAIEKVKEAGALAGIHCCGKADWELVLGLRPDIVNFDAYGYFDTIELYRDELAGLVRAGGMLAWGIVPTTSDELAKATLDGMRGKFLDSLDRLSGHMDGQALLDRCLLTPSCGTGSLEREEAQKVFTLLKELKQSLLETFGG